MTRKRAGATRKQYNEDDLAYAVAGQRFFPNGEIQTLQELRRVWRSSRQFREQVLAYAYDHGKTEADIFMMHDDGADPDHGFLVPDGKGGLKRVKRLPSTTSTRKG